jgi:hypothetical protein
LFSHKGERKYAPLLNLIEMREIVTISILLVVLSFKANGQQDFKRNLIQVGRSGYYFGDNPFKIGKAGGFTNHGIRIYTYAPYLSYSRRQFKHIGFRASFEEYDVSYCKNCPHPEPMKVINRSFYQAQVGILGFASISSKFELIGSLSGVRRFDGSEYGIRMYIDQGWWLEAIWFGHNINGWGGAAGLEVKYKFFKGFIIALKGEHITLNKKPKNQTGITGSLGYEF